MASGFTGGGAPDFFTGRSTNQAPQPSSRSNLPGLFLDPSTQIARHQQQLQQQPQQPHTIIGKRTLSDYQAHQFQNNQAGLNGFFYRSVKPRTFQHTSPISPLSPTSTDQTRPTSTNRSSQAPIVPQASIKHLSFHKHRSFQSSTDLSLCWFVCVGLFVYLCVDLSVWMCFCVGVFVCI